eukprot:3048080-Pleurochrysis_carterae.AAC.2
MACGRRLAELRVREHACATAGHETPLCATSWQRVFCAGRRVLRASCVQAGTRWGGDSMTLRVTEIARACCVPEASAAAPAFRGEWRQAHAARGAPGAALLPAREPNCQSHRQAHRQPRPRTKPQFELKVACSSNACYQLLDSDITTLPTSGWSASGSRPKR